MTVWIVHRDIPYEFGHIVDVYDSEEKAEMHMKRCLEGKEEGYSNEDPENWSVEKWGVG